MPIQCQTCEAILDGDNVYTKWFYTQNQDPKLILNQSAAYTRFCQYAVARGKDCPNKCREIDPRHTLEARSMGILKHPGQDAPGH